MFTLPLIVSSSNHSPGVLKSSLKMMSLVPGENWGAGVNIWVGAGIGVSVAGNHSTVAVGDGEGVTVIVGKGAGVGAARQEVRLNARRKKMIFRMRGL